GVIDAGAAALQPCLRNSAAEVRISAIFATVAFREKDCSTVLRAALPSNDVNSRLPRKRSRFAASACLRVHIHHCRLAFTLFVPARPQGSLRPNLTVYTALERDHLQGHRFR